MTFGALDTAVYNRLEFSGLEYPVAINVRIANRYGARSTPGSTSKVSDGQALTKPA